MKLTLNKIVQEEYQVDLSTPKFMKLSTIFWKFWEVDGKMVVIRMTLDSGDKFQMDYREAMSHDLEDFKKMGTDYYEEIAEEEFKDTLLTHLQYIK
jgi:hypothetical protein